MGLYFMVAFIVAALAVLSLIAVTKIYIYIFIKSAGRRLSVRELLFLTARVAVFVIIDLRLSSSAYELTLRARFLVFARFFSGGRKACPLCYLPRSSICLFYKTANLACSTYSSSSGRYARGVRLLVPGAAPLVKQAFSDTKPG